MTKIILLILSVVVLYSNGAVADDPQAKKDNEHPDSDEKLVEVSEPKAEVETRTELELRAEIARAEAEKAKAEAEKARAEAERAKAETMKAEAERANEESGKAEAVKSSDRESEKDMTATDNAQLREDETQPNHRGFYFRFTPGLGLGTAWARGTMDPLPGIERIDDPRHSTLTGTIGLDLGAGIVRNLALHVGTFFEKMILRKKEPTRMAFSIFGVDAGLTWYFTELELYLTGQFRWVGMLVKYPEVSRTEYFEDTFDWYKGPGFSVTFGKEWYDDANDQHGTGIGLQTNYYRTHGGIDDHQAFNHFSLLLVLTSTRF
jgi:hypothetical protein